jgi:hypothetical protein
MNQQQTILSLLFSFITNFLFAQSIGENLCQLVIKLDSDQEMVQKARYHQSAKEQIRVELYNLVFKNGNSSYGKKTLVAYNKEKDAWILTLPYGMYYFRTEHIGFDNFNETIELDQPNFTLEKKLSTGKLPYCYENGKKFNYIKGGIEFSETIVVHFKAGTMEENKAFLETFPYESIQKLRFVNSFLLTLNLKNQESLAEILIRESWNDPTLTEGFFIGEEITEIIEKISSNPNVKYANPSFIYPKEKVQILDMRDYNSRISIINDLRATETSKVKRLNSKDFEQTEELKLKLSRVMEGN